MSEELVNKNRNQEGDEGTCNAILAEQGGDFNEELGGCLTNSWTRNTSETTPKAINEVQWCA